MVGLRGLRKLRKCGSVDVCRCGCWVEGVKVWMCGRWKEGLNVCRCGHVKGYTAFMGALLGAYLKQSVNTK